MMLLSTDEERAVHRLITGRWTDAPEDRAAMLGLIKKAERRRLTRDAIERALREARP